MTYRLAVLTFGFGALVAVPALADVATAQPVQTTTTEHVKFAAGGTIRLVHSFGYLSVEGWDQPEVEITVVKSMGYDSEPATEAAQHLEGVHVVTERRSDTELAISTTRGACPSRFTHPLGKCRDVKVEYRIRAPRNSHLVISHSGGFVSVTGVTGNIEATNTRGDIVLMVPDLTVYSIDAHTKAGIVTSDATDANRSKHLLGETFSRGGAAPSRRLSLRMGYGGIAIKALPPETLAPAASAR